MNETSAQLQSGAGAGAALGTGRLDFAKAQDVYGDVPAARFGHSTTVVSQNLMVLFGGAVGDSGQYTITNDVYLWDLSSRQWSRLVTDNPPTARAAHAAAKVDLMQAIVYGGATGGGSLSSEDLWLLDLRKGVKRTSKTDHNTSNNTSSSGGGGGGFGGSGIGMDGGTVSWIMVPITGTTPGRRYGHTMCYFKPNIILFGGNNGASSLSDVWFMNSEVNPFQWNEVVLPMNAKKPMERIYHSAAICRDGPASGMMVVFGGRSIQNQSLRDVWGLRQHRNGSWDWIAAPTKRGSLPDARFQHTCLFLGTKLFIIGGRDTDVGRAVSSALYDTETCAWTSFAGMGRFRHSSWVFNHAIYAFGGFDHCTQTHPSGDLLVCNALETMGLLSGLGGVSGGEGGAHRGRLAVTAGATSGGGGSLGGGGGGAGSNLGGTSGAGGNRSSLGEQRTPLAKTAGFEGRHVRLSAHVHTRVDGEQDFSALVRKVSIDRLGEEARKIRGHATPLHPSHALRAPDKSDRLADYCIKLLLKPNISMARIDHDFNSMNIFCLTSDHVSQLIERAIEVFKREPCVLRLRAPIKVYGDVHGQYYDLMRMFGIYKSPMDESWCEDYTDADDVQGDIESTDYLFLGDYVDRGTNSLEVMCLLLALKLRHPKQIHLIRGNHEDAAINGTYGFRDECRRRLESNPDDAGSCWNKFNKLFEYLPIGALIEDHILCIHGGIGGSINTVADIEGLKRPLKVSQLPVTEDEQKLTDLLWSDPTDNDSMTGVIPNDIRDPERTGHIVKFGPDRVLDFIEKNHLGLILRAHECVMDGFERFAGGRLITIFSATDYCNTHKNAGALLFVQRDMTLVPKLIYPAARDVGVVRSTWLDLHSRPATPPRSTRKVEHFDNSNNW